MIFDVGFIKLNIKMSFQERLYRTNEIFLVYSVSQRSALCTLCTRKTKNPKPVLTPQEPSFKDTD